MNTNPLTWKLHSSNPLTIDRGAETLSLHFVLSRRLDPPRIIASAIRNEVTALSELASLREAMANRAAVTSQPAVLVTSWHGGSTTTDDRPCREAQRRLDNARAAARAAVGSAVAAIQREQPLRIKLVEEIASRCPDLLERLAAIVAWEGAMSEVVLDGIIDLIV